MLALPFTTLRDVDLSHAGIPALHRRAIHHEPLGSNAKMFLQFTDRTWVEANETGNAYCAGVVQGAWDAAGYQSGAAGILAALPGGKIGTDWGSRYHLTNYRGNAPAAMVHDYLTQFNEIFPGVKSAYNGKSYYVWSTGDPHIRGAYSYLKVGQYTGFNGIQGRREGNLHFAGEHTSVNFQGYIEGALAQRPALRERDRRQGLASGQRRPSKAKRQSKAGRYYERTLQVRLMRPRNQHMPDERHSPLVVSAFWVGASTSR